MFSYILMVPEIMGIILLMVSSHSIIMAASLCVCNATVIKHFLQICSCINIYYLSLGLSPHTGNAQRSAWWITTSELAWMPKSLWSSTTRGMSTLRSAGAVGGYFSTLSPALLDSRSAVGWIYVIACCFRRAHWFLRSCEFVMYNDVIQGFSDLLHSRNFLTVNKKKETNHAHSPYWFINKLFKHWHTAVISWLFIGAR